MAERGDAAPWGAFPIRFPVGKALGLFLTLALVPVFWGLNDEFGRTALQQRYALTYVKVQAQAFGHPHNVGKFGTKEGYLMLVEGPDDNRALVDDEELTRISH